jgi:hypothetical protein
MNVAGLTIDIERCPDGVELVDLPEVLGKPLTWGHQPTGLMVSGDVLTEYQPAGKIFRYRTERREPKTIMIENLEDPVVIRFVNASDEKRRIQFFDRFGLLCGRLGDDPYDDILQKQTAFRTHLKATSAYEPDSSMLMVNTAIEHNRFSLRPTFHLAGPRGKPRLLLRGERLFGFMIMEMAMIVAHGARVSECENCSTIFLTGPLTGHRSSARFCTDRCRMAAMRARQAASA